MNARRPITLAVAALGGEGGGVICDWLIDIARRAGYLAQATSVPGVAQRTGATIYYLEFFPIVDLPQAGARPVFALMPNPGDVDIVIASEIVECGRMLQRGLVTKKTTLITSSHRIYSIQEKSHLADGRADTTPIRALAATQAKRFIEFDMQALAALHGSPISAALVGALCGSGVLPFAEKHYRGVIQDSGMKVQANLAAFEAACKRATLSPCPPLADPPMPLTPPLSDHFEARLAIDVPAEVRNTVRAGISRLIDYQGSGYAALYLARLGPILEWDRSTRQSALSESVARGLALWMSFEDIIRVADLKIRAARLQRIRMEVRSGAQQLVTVTEFLSPRLEELVATLPPKLGKMLLRSGSMRRLLSKLLKPREVSTSTVRGFLLLYTLASLRRWRRRSRRYLEEEEAMLDWLTRINDAKHSDYGLAVQLGECQQLLKGYGATHERGRERFAAILAKGSAWKGEPAGAERVRALRLAALADEEGKSFSLALQTV